LTPDKGRKRDRGRWCSDANKEGVHYGGRLIGQGKNKKKKWKKAQKKRQEREENTPREEKVEGKGAQSGKAVSSTREKWAEGREFEYRQKYGSRGKGCVNQKVKIREAYTRDSGLKVEWGWNIPHEKPRKLPYGCVDVFLS